MSWGLAGMARGLDHWTAGMATVYDAQYHPTQVNETFVKLQELAGVPPAARGPMATVGELGLDLTLGWGISRAAAWMQALNAKRMAGGNIEAAMLWMRLNGTPYGEARLAALRGYLLRREIELVENADEFLKKRKRMDFLRQLMTGVAFFTYAVIQLNMKYGMNQSIFETSSALV